MNILKLKSVMVSAGETQASLADKIGMCRPRLSLKINQKAMFTLAEVQKIVELLNMSSAEVMEIFFHRKEN